MYISLNWIKDFVDLDGIDVKDIANKFTLSCAEVEDVIEKGNNISGIISARIEKVENHPSSKKLHILSVNTGKDVLQVVCGAPNVRENMVTAFAPIGARIGDITIGKASLVGVDSFGMCCSARELDVADDNSGIMDLGDDTEIGVDLKKLLPIEDTLLDVDNKSLTNRPDMWGHYGIAREIAAITGRKLKAYDIDEKDYSSLPSLDIQVESDSCNRYSALRIGGVTKNVSPLTMQIRLYYCGMRAISLLADLTNYIMLELGQPMHSFAGDKVESITVRDIDHDTPFKTLDGVDRVLPTGTMVIDLNSQIGAIAGVMGGLSSEIEDETHSTFIESATFDAFKVRKTATSLGLRSEASARYEKSLDPEMTTIAIRRYVKLLQNIDGGMVVESNISDVYPHKYPHIVIEIDKSYIDKYAGIDISMERIVEILTSIGFKVKVNGQSLSVDVPSYRATKDISIKADIVEEITRIYGYDNITPNPMMQPVTLDKTSIDIGREYDVKYALADRYNMHEIHSYLWEDKVANNALGIETESYIKLINSLQKDNDCIRSSMMPTILRALMQNKKYDDSVGVFEIGHIVPKMNGNLASDEKALGMGWIFDKEGLSEKLGMARDIIHYIFDYVMSLDVSLVPATPKENYLAPVNYYKVVSDGQELGVLGVVHPEVQYKVDKDKYTILCEINISMLSSKNPREVKFEKVSKYPVTTLDFNFVLGMDEHYSAIESVAGLIDSELSYKFELVDIFENKSDSTKSYTIRYYVTSMDHTLSSSEIEEFHKLVISTFDKSGISLKAE